MGWNRAWRKRLTRSRIILDSRGRKPRSSLPTTDRRHPFSRSQRNLELASHLTHKTTPHAGAQRQRRPGYPVAIPSSIPREWEPKPGEPKRGGRNGVISRFGRGAETGSKAVFEDSIQREHEARSHVAQKQPRTPVAEPERRPAYSVPRHSNVSDEPPVADTPATSFRGCCLAIQSR
jgi:hypothetical protein